MRFERGDVVFGTDPFKTQSSGRPFLLISDAETPFHGDQYLGMSLTTRTWHDETIPIRDADWMRGSSPLPSSLVPWSVNTIFPDDIEYQQGTLDTDLVETACEQLAAYVTE